MKTYELWYDGRYMGLLDLLPSEVAEITAQDWKISLILVPALTKQPIKGA